MESGEGVRRRCEWEPSVVPASMFSSLTYRAMSFCCFALVDLTALRTAAWVFHSRSEPLSHSPGPAFPRHSPGTRHSPHLLPISLPMQTYYRLTQHIWPFRALVRLVCANVILLPPAVEARQYIQYIIALIPANRPTDCGPTYDKQHHFDPTR